jgi:hypothetical protein
VAEAHYNASVEAWGDRVEAAGARLCRFFQRRGMKDLDCPEQATHPPLIRDGP